MPLTPYVVGQWVRGKKFYGRIALIDEILQGHRNCLWLLGTRRIGKTSILKQLENVTSRSPALGFFPVFWDFQGSGEPDDLHESFGESLLDVINRLDTLGIPLDKIEADDLFGSISRLRRALGSKGLTLLLLCDEVEELVGINEKAPRFLRRLRRALQSAEYIRTVLASSIKLWDLAYEETRTSPFLHGFTPPLFVHGITDKEARLLICQSQLPEDSRPQLDEHTTEKIRSHCNNHPYLLQLLSERYLELEDLEQAIEEIATDQMVSHFFAVDFEMLAENEKNIIRTINTQIEATNQSIRETLFLESTSLHGNLRRLEHLGFIHHTSNGGYSLANYFFKRWLDELPKPKQVDEIDAGLESTIQDNSVETVHLETPFRLIDNRYDLQECLGRGATGQVYRAYDTMLRIPIAVKLLNKEYCVDMETFERLRREVILSRNLSHPNILKVYHLGDDHGLKYITMEYIEGPDFAQVLSQAAPLPSESAVSIAIKLASALQAAHECKVLHRDIKPSNILIDPSGEPRITDFGLARLLGGADITRTGSFLGTPAYASPEQIRGEIIDERMDLYALGVVIFEMVTGRRPFIGDSILKMHLNDTPPSPRDLEPRIPEALSELILCCLAKDPAHRFQNAKELVAALKNIEL